MSETKPPPGRPPHKASDRGRTVLAVFGVTVLVALAVVAGQDHPGDANRTQTRSGAQQAGSQQAAVQAPRASASPARSPAPGTTPSSGTTPAPSGQPRVTAAKGLTAPQSRGPAQDAPAQEEPRGKAPVIFEVDTKDRVFFITIDDGNVRDEGLRDWLLAKQIPVTAFLTKDPASIDYDYFSAFGAWGTEVQNHSLHHDDLSEMSQDDQQRDICRTSAAFARHFGHRPTLFRPPYGAYNEDTRRAAARCGITHLVYWTAEYKDGFMEYEYGSDRLHRGDIVLLHFNDDTLDEIRWVIRDAARVGLKPAALEQYL